MLRILVALLAVLLIIGIFPAWPYSVNWGYYPSGTALIIAVFTVFILVSSRRGDVV